MNPHRNRPAPLPSLVVHAPFVFGGFQVITKLLYRLNQGETFTKVRDRTTLYLNTLGGDGAVVETDDAVKEFLFGSLGVPLTNQETSLKNYEPSEEQFDIHSVPREVKSQPLAEKKAPGKKPTGLGAPPVVPTSTVDIYERLLSSIPEFASYGKLFKKLKQSMQLML